MYKVIIVEDDKGIAEGICDCLADWGMEARRIKDFRRVMEEIRERRRRKIQNLYPGKPGYRKTLILDPGDITVSELMDEWFHNTA